MAHTINPAFQPVRVETIRERLERSFDQICGKEWGVMNTNWEVLLGHDASVPRKLVDDLDISDKLSVLDIGCGEGVTLFQAMNYFSKKNPFLKIEATGITGALNHLVIEPGAEIYDEYARKTLVVDCEPLICKDETIPNKMFEFENGSTVKFYELNAHFLSELDQKFDLIYSMRSFFHFYAPIVAFDKACDALNNDGLMLITFFDDQVYDLNCKNISLTLGSEKLFNRLDDKNPEYAFYPFCGSGPLCVKKNTKKDLASNIYMASCEKLSGHIVAVDFGQHVEEKYVHISEV